ncbi:unnamed protein product [Ilex paraguariensis]|uniref:Uncharacterized protein n=1 Tax=Ilex paraguariensis TaxID=185542 RepID=A0ABC8R0P1_9AQUA
MCCQGEKHKLGIKVSLTQQNRSTGFFGIKIIELWLDYLYSYSSSLESFQLKNGGRSQMDLRGYCMVFSFFLFLYLLMVGSSYGFLEVLR